MCIKPVCTAHIEPSKRSILVVPREGYHSDKPNIQQAYLNGLLGASECGVPPVLKTHLRLAAVSKMESPTGFGK